MKKKAMDGKRKIQFSLMIGLLLVVLGFLLNLEPKPVDAACGASTSSCKTCHEVKGQDPVSKKGDWHTQHAFGDFCQACHQGVATANDKTQAHVGIIAKPLAQSSETCASCHPSDTAERVAKYGGTVAISTGGPGSGGSGPAGSNPDSTATQAQGTNTVAVSDAAKQIPPSSNPNFDLIDFNKYAQSHGSLLAWILGIFNALVFIVLLTLIWRWKTGVWPWAYLKRDGDWINLYTLPVEAQILIKRLLKSDLETVLTLNDLFEESKDDDTLIAAMIRETSERVVRDQKNGAQGSFMKEGKDHVI